MFDIIRSYEVMIQPSAPASAPGVRKWTSRQTTTLLSLFHYKAKPGLFHRRVTQKPCFSSVFRVFVPHAFSFCMIASPVLQSISLKTLLRKRSRINTEKLPRKLLLLMSPSSRRIGDPVLSNLPERRKNPLCQILANASA